MRKLPCQELLTINYSSRYPRLRATPFSGRSPPLLMQMTTGPAARGHRATQALATYSPLHEGISRGTSGERERREARKIAGHPISGGRSANCHEFTFYCARPRQTAGALRLPRIFIRFLFTTSHRHRPIRTRIPSRRRFEWRVISTALDLPRIDQRITNGKSDRRAMDESFRFRDFRPFPPLPKIDIRTFRPRNDCSRWSNNRPS